MGHNRLDLVLEKRTYINTRCVSHVLLLVLLSDFRAAGEVCVLTSSEEGCWRFWREDQAGYTFGCDHVCVAWSLVRQPLFSEEGSRPEPCEHLLRAVSCLTNDINRPGEDQVEAVGGFALLNNGEASGIPANSNMITAVVQQARFFAEQHQGISEIQVSLEPLLCLDKPLDQLIEQQLWPGWEMAVVELLWSVRCQPCLYLLRELMAVATAQASGSGGSTDGDMIGMTVTTIRSKSDDDVRAEATKKFHYILDQYFLVDVFESAISVVETPGMLDA